MTTQACSEARMPSGPQTGPVSQDMEKYLEDYAHTLPVVPVEVPEGFPSANRLFTGTQKFLLETRLEEQGRG